MYYLYSEIILDFLIILVKFLFIAIIKYVLDFAMEIHKAQKA